MIDTHTMKSPLMEKDLIVYRGGLDFVCSLRLGIRNSFRQVLAFPLFTRLVGSCCFISSTSSCIAIETMSAAGGTFRGTPHRGQGRGQVPAFDNNSPSNIPRPKLESHTSSALQSENGTSTLSASRQKQAKRDEVCLGLPSSKCR